LKRYRQVNQKYQDFKAEKILVKDKAAIYIHKINNGTFFTGIIVGTSIEEYRINNIKTRRNYLFRVDLRLHEVFGVQYRACFNDLL
jgi:uncharacterized protein (DUF1015 family)